MFDVRLNAAVFPGLNLAFLPFSKMCLSKNEFFDTLTHTDAHTSHSRIPTNIKWTAAFSSNLMLEH